MSAGTYNIVVEQNARFYLPMAYKDSTGALIDLTGATAKLHVRKVPSAPLIKEFTAADVGPSIKLMTDPDYNVIFDWSQAVTAALPPGEFTYDCLINDDRFLEGQFIVKPAVTHA